MSRKGQDAPKPNQSQAGTTQHQGDPFVQHLEHMSKVVQTWPAWKQQLLGGTATPPPGLSTKAEGSDR